MSSHWAPWRSTLLKFSGWSSDGLRSNRNWNLISMSKFCRNWWTRGKLRYALHKHQLFARYNCNLMKRKELILRKELRSVEKLEEFYHFVSDGIQFVLSKGDSATQEDANSSSISSGSTLARLRDVQALVTRITDQLKTGLRDQTDIFSTNADDYIGKDWRHVALSPTRLQKQAYFNILYRISRVYWLSIKLLIVTASIMFPLNCMHFRLLNAMLSLLLHYHLNLNRES